MKIKYRLSSSTWGKKEIEAIQNVIDSEMYTMGNYVKSFEKNLHNFWIKILFNG